MHFGVIYIFMILALLTSVYAQIQVISTRNVFIKMKNLKGFTGAQTARTILNNKRMTDIRVEMTSEYSSDNYDPKGVVVRLSEQVYNGDSLVSIGIAAYEVGHAILDATNDYRFKIRTVLAPIANICASISWFVIIIGILFEIGGAGGVFIWLGIFLYILGVFISLITLPVELNASKMALSLLDEGGYLSSNEYHSVKKVLNAASLAYIAGCLTAIVSLFRKIITSSDE